MCLTRRENEIVVIKCPDGQELIVSVAEARRGRVVLGFSGPEEYRFVRPEVAGKAVPAE